MKTSVTKRARALAKRVTGMLVFAAIVFYGAVSPSKAQTSSSYSLQHNFTFWPGWWPIWPGQPGWWFTPVGYGSAWADARAWQPGFPLAHQWQNTGFRPMPPIMNIAANAVADSGSSHADAHSTVSLQPFGMWGLTLGTVRAWGNASVGSAPGSFANANSSANYFMWGGPVWWRWGWIRWQPILWSSVSGSASASTPWPRRRDPISFEIFDSGGNVVESAELMYINLDGTGDGEFTWDENGLISINPSINPGSSLVWEMSIKDAPGKDYVPDDHEGLLRLAIEGGVVTESYHDGRFSTWTLPEIGTSGPLQINAEPIDLPLDFGRDVDARIWAIGEVPEPGAVVLFGLGILTIVLSRRVRRL